MKNLQELFVEELSLNETSTTNGGIWLAIVALTIAALNTDWDKAGSDLSRGWNSF